MPSRLERPLPCRGVLGLVPRATLPRAPDVEKKGAPHSGAGKRKPGRISLPGPDAGGKFLPILGSISDMTNIEQIVPLLRTDTQ